MTVLTERDFDRLQAVIDPVEDLSDHEDVATLLEDWAADLASKKLDWMRVLSVYQDQETRGYCFLLAEEGVSTGFDLFGFIAEKGGPNLTPLTAKRVVGKGRGVSRPPALRSPEPKKPVAVPETVGSSTVFGGTATGFAGDEDDISTGFFDDEDDFDDTAGVSYTLEVERTGDKFQVGNREVKVGRGSDCDIQLLGNKRLSRVHAIFSVEGSKLYVEDQQSSNGTYVNGYEQDWGISISQDDVISLGGDTIRVLSGEQ